MIELYQPETSFGLPNLSPFCAKVETYLRMAELEYEVKRGIPPKGPKKKVPWIVDGSEKLADSSLIVRYLQERYLDPLDRNLTAHDRARGHAIQTMLEEHLYFVMLWQRWISDAGWRIVEPAFFGKIPPGVRQLLRLYIRRQFKRNLWGQGIGRHSPDQIDEFGVTDIHALAELLGDNQYILGDEPRSFDASAFGFLVNIVEFPLDTQTRMAALAHDNLVAYVARMKSRYFPELTLPPPAVATDG